MKPKKPVIVIASLLKPVTDTRMYEKFARSLVTNLPVEVHIVGYQIQGTLPAEDSIIFHPLFNFSRLSWGRFTAFLELYNFYRQVRPQLVMVNNTDFLPVTVFFSVLFNVPFVYDVRENYMLNIIATKVFPQFIRWPLATVVRVVERISAKFASGFVVAERVYLQQLPYLNKNTIVAENKVVKAIVRQYHSKTLPISLRNVPIRLLYTGTIAEHYGIFEAISLAEALNTIDNDITLTIAGYCADNAVLSKVKKRLAGLDFIKLVGGEKPIDHKALITMMSEANVGLLPYQASKSTLGRIPTRLFEYLAFTLPMLIQPDPLWEEISSPWAAALMTDFSNFNAEKLLIELKTKLFYTNGFPDNVFWEEEELKLISLVKEIIAN